MTKVSVQRIWSLPNPTSRDNSEGFLLVSLTHNASQLLRWRSEVRRGDGFFWDGGLDIEDITPTALFDTTTSCHISYPMEPTLAAAMTNSGLFQVLQSGIVLNGHLTRCHPASRIVLSSISGPDACIAFFSDPLAWFLSLIRTEGPFSYSRENSILLLGEPTAIKLFQHREYTVSALVLTSSVSAENGSLGTKFCIVAIRHPHRDKAIHMYRFDPNGVPEHVASGPCKKPPGIANPEEEEVRPEGQGLEVNAIEIVSHEGGDYLLLMGMRDGSLTTCKMSCREPFLPPSHSWSNTKVGISPVELISTSMDGTTKEKIFIGCDSLWELGFQDGEIEFHEVLFDDIRLAWSILEVANESQG